MRELPPRARWYLLTVGALALAVVAVSATRVTAWADVAAFAVLYGLATFFVTVTANNLSMSVGFIVALASVAVLGPYGAALVATMGFLQHGNLRLYKRVFNAAQFVLCAFLAGLAFALVAGPAHDFRNVGGARAVAATLLASLVYCVLNGSLVAGVIALTSGLNLRRVWSGRFEPVALVYLAYGILGLLLAEIYQETRVVSVLLFLVPLLVARRAFANYAQLQEAYDGTVRALVQAVETKDYYTRGHSERVSTVTELIAREWGMREDRVQVIRIAGMLHDVGKLGVPTKVLQKQGKLNQLEFEAIKLHPLKGYEMLSEIDFLAEALTGVYHHHERMDGRGYPLGLTGEEVPLFARIIMVADAFDSMTSTRSYRHAKSVAEALTELRRCEGGQFDVRVVDCLARAVERHGWEPTPEYFQGERVGRDGQPLGIAAVEPRSVGATGG